jgi:hypothetical protein
MIPNLHHSSSPHCQTQPGLLDSEDLPSTSRKVDRCQILLKIEIKIALSVGCRIKGLQRSNVLDVDDDMYPIISRYRYFSLKRHETNRHSSELVFESINSDEALLLLLSRHLHERT